jgi:hypothetical protein
MRNTISKELSFGSLSGEYGTQLRKAWAIDSSRTCIVQPVNQSLLKLALATGFEQMN